MASEAILPYRFMVERAIEPDVTIGIGGPRVILAGDQATYSVALQNLSNLDAPYTFFEYGCTGTADQRVCLRTALPELLHESCGGRRRVRRTLRMSPYRGHDWTRSPIPTGSLPRRVCCTINRQTASRV